MSEKDRTGADHGQEGDETHTDRLAGGNPAPDDGLWPTPATDPTNPFRQEATGEFVAAEKAADRKTNEPGGTHRP